MRHFTTRFVCALWVAWFLAAKIGCGRAAMSVGDAPAPAGPPYAGEWVLDGKVDGDGNFTPAAANEMFALRFDPPAAVQGGRYDPTTSTVDRDTITIGPYAVFAGDAAVVQWGAVAAGVESGHLRVIYPGDGSLRMSRPKQGLRLFREVTPEQMGTLIAELERAPAAEGGGICPTGERLAK